MSLDFFRKLNWTFGLIVLGILLGIVAYAATIEVRDLDLWLHLRMGDWIAQHGYVPNVDVLSCSFQGKPWINHEWLFQWLVSRVRAGYGLDGLICFQSGIVLTTFFLLLALVHDRRRHLLHGVLLLLVLEVYQTRFTIRPDILSLFFFVVYIHVLSSWLHRWWSVPLLFLVQLVWTNVHGFSLWGIVLVGIALMAEGIKRRVPLPWEWGATGRLEDEEFRRLWRVLGAVILASFITPLGVEGALYPLKTLFDLGGDSRIFFKHITELQPPVTWANALDTQLYWPYKALILLSTFSFFINRRRIDISGLLLWGVFLLFSLGAVRNMTYFAFAAFLVTAHNLARVRLEDVLPFRAVEERFVHLTLALAGLMFAFYLASFAADLAAHGYYDFDRYERKSEFFGISRRNYPEKAADFLRASGIHGNFFNDFNSGAYLIGRLYPQIMVFMDGRTELRGSRFFMEYNKIWNEGDGALFDAMVARYRLRGAFINTSGGFAPKTVLRMMAARPEWVPVYFDYDAVIFLRDIPANAEAIARYRLDLAAWQPVELDLETLGPVRVVPYRNVRRARTLMDLGLDAPAYGEALAALRVLPTYDEALNIAGEIELRRGQARAAFEHFRLACAQSNGVARFRRNLAKGYLAIGNRRRAVEEARQALALDAADKTARYVLAQTLVKNGQYNEGYDILSVIPQAELEKEGLGTEANALLAEINSVRTKVGR